MYADNITNAKNTDETLYGEKQQKYNLKNNLTPKALNKTLDNALSKIDSHLCPELVIENPLRPKTDI